MTDGGYGLPLSETEAWIFKWAHQYGVVLPLDAAAALSEKLSSVSNDDGARLDWLERHPRLGSILIDGRPQDCYFYAVAGAFGVKLREIIDAAREGEQ